MYGDVTTNGIFWFVENLNSNGFADFRRFDKEYDALVYRDYELDKKDKIIKHHSYFVNGTEFFSLDEAEKHLNKEIKRTNRRDILSNSKVMLSVCETDDIVQNWDALKDIMNAE